MSTHFHDLIQKAIAIEAKMAEFYRTMTTKATTPETREVFKILAGEEEEHRVLLENYLEKGEFPQVSQIKAADLEPTLREVASITPDISYRAAWKEFLQAIAKPATRRIVILSAAKNLAFSIG
jgi:rubrerythrin